MKSKVTLINTQPTNSLPVISRFSFNLTPYFPPKSINSARFIPFGADNGSIPPIKRPIEAGWELMERTGQIRSHEVVATPGLLNDFLEMRIISPHKISLIINEAGGRTDEMSHQEESEEVKNYNRRLESPILLGGDSVGWVPGRGRVFDLNQILNWGEIEAATICFQLEAAAQCHGEESRQPWSWETVEAPLLATPAELRDGDLVNGQKQLVRAEFGIFKSKGLGQIMDLALKQFNSIYNPYKTKTNSPNNKLT